MGSSSKPKTAEELAARQAEFDAQAKAMSDRRTVTLVGASGLGSSMASIGAPGTQEGGKRGRNDYGGDLALGSTHAVNTDKDGREYINIGGAQAYWSPEHGEWRGTGHDSAGGNHAASRFYTSNNVAASSGGGGGGKKKKPKPPKKDPPVTYPGDPGPTVQTTPESAFNVGPGWSNWSPPGGGTGNPLWDQYDPWMPDPEHGIWTNPGIINTNPGVLI